MNNEERELWIMNDEGLYDWWRSTGLSMREFIRKNWPEVDAAIAPVIKGTKPAHHLKYGPMGATKGGRPIKTRRDRMHSWKRSAAGMLHTVIREGDYLAEGHNFTAGPYRSDEEAYRLFLKKREEEPLRILRVVKLRRDYGLDVDVVWEREDA